MSKSNTSSNNKPLSASCSTCQRMTNIEGEFICFREGKIIGLKPTKEPSLQPKLICDGWKMGKPIT
ncbi:MULTISPECIES: hypothetical protein [unclassified Shewanella]|uniref:hypothetical protein n=1 Tax=unclassified Shewanella TaxID=196818 RepID=UPI001BC05B52|nr:MULTISPECIES: hypothetical protein [unclassified Shewanella]GIU11764.1 hypothetical protein TUM4444_18230 [Shewanella sp. MBTL60-112-B1]